MYFIMVKTITSRYNPTPLDLTSSYFFRNFFPFMKKNKFWLLVTCVLSPSPLCCPTIKKTLCYVCLPLNFREYSWRSQNINFIFFSRYLKKNNWFTKLSGFHEKGLFSIHYLYLHFLCIPLYKISWATAFRRQTVSIQIKTFIEIGHVK